MHTQTLDCRNEACPIPVLRTKEALEAMDEGILDVIVDNVASRENVKRFATRMGCYFEEKRLEDGTTQISIVKGYECRLPDDETSQRAETIVEKERSRRTNRSVWALLLGGIVSAVLASTCCIGPLLFLLFGVSVGSAGFLHLLAPYHTLFTLVAAGVTLWLWIEYFRKRNIPACETILCRKYVWFLGAGTLLVIVMLTYPWWVVFLVNSE
ncbi:mercuric transporter MerT family protein [Hydrogenimonas sp. SS33]|uniref:mercuric transporter MerT family protein n=1 Tax=Hydrogenimonas leucolamina TaxID=2954236 RepID=UPI00336BB8B9